MKNYDHKKIEKKWQEAWAKSRLYETKDSVSGKDNFYILVEFPYPSGNLHVGHWYSFAVPDILARKLRMEGKNVLYPIGFDAFGLPAENAAIKNKVNPREWTESNIDYMRKQLRSMGASFDWSREVITCDPDYYKWTQWLFLQLYKSNLVYRKETMVNWCPNDKTVLANEQVVDGKCERCGHEVIQKEMLQWNIKITDYADRLVDDLEKLDWPEPIKESQRNWIGRSGGAEIDFPLEFDNKGGPKPNYLLLHGYTGRADKNFIPWLKLELEKRGLEVQAPQLPNTDAPKESEQVGYVLEHCRIDEHTIIVGHSLGAIVGMKALLKHGKKVAGIVIVAAAMDPKSDIEDKPFHRTFTWDMDFGSMQKLTSFRQVLSDNRETHRKNYLMDMAAKLAAPIIEDTAKRKHFTAVEEPFVLTSLLPHLTVFTTRPDTLFGATYLVLAPEHPWVTLALQHKTVLKNNDEVAKYVEQAKKKTELERQENREKTGVKLEGVEALNPATGEKIPLFVADYVLAGYGTGAIMAVPAHDERDFEFATKFKLPIRQVIRPEFTDTNNPPRSEKEEVYRRIVEVFVRKRNGGTLLLFWKGAVWGARTPVTGIVGGIEKGEDAVEAARREVLEETGYKNLVHVQTIPFEARTRFFAAHKDENRLADATGIVFELANEERDDVDPKEMEKHEPRFVSETEVAKLLNVPDPLFLWNSFLRPSAYAGQGILVNSGEFDGLTVEEAKKKMTEKFGRRKTTYKLRDWIVSRQRYWGVPIPIIHCPKCGIVPVPEDQLPVLLPETDDYLPDGKGKSPLAKVSSFVNVKCPQCGGDAERETDTLDTFVDSSWYFLRYTDPHDEKEFATKNKQANWMPVDLYSGGAEHTTMHLLYSRFWHKALFDRGLVADSEPYIRRMNRGIILGPDGQKMSKSHGNVVDPDEIVERLGADTVRMYLAFIGPYNEVTSYPWNPNGVVGVRRFLERVWRLAGLVGQDKKYEVENYEIEKLLNKTIKKVAEDVSVLKFNTAISAMMICINAAEKTVPTKRQFSTFLKILAPFAPHISEELWQEMGNTASIHNEPWPTYDQKLAKDEKITIAVQINGKLRATIVASADASEIELTDLAEKAVSERLEGKEVKATIVIPGRVVNIVTS